MKIACDPEMAYVKASSIKNIGASNLSNFNIWHLLVKRRVELCTKSGPMQVEMKTSDQQNCITLLLAKLHKTRKSHPKLEAYKYRKNDAHETGFGEEDKNEEMNEAHPSLEEMNKSNENIGAVFTTCDSEVSFVKAWNERKMSNF